MKERLTGAIILVAFIVLLVPELLTGPVRSGPAPPATATSAEEPPLRSYTIDLADEPRSHAAASGSPGTTAESGESAQPAPAEANAVNPGSITEGPAATAQGAQASQAPAPADSAPVPSSRPTASSMSAAGPAAPSATTALTPAPKAVPAALAAPRVSSATAKPSAAAKPSSAGAGAAEAWMVQLGVFANRTNADRLAQELKGKGFRVAVSEASGGGRKLFRVRAGPLADRSAATDLAARLRAAGASASVVPRT